MSCVHVPGKSSFSLGQSRRIIRDLFKPSAAIYWTDFLLSYGVGLACYAAVRRLPLFSAAQIACFVVSSLLFYRTAMFIHELVHLPKDSFKLFRLVWNLLCGIPFLVPSFVYYTHVDHHRRAHYGTKRDGEYLALGHGPPRNILLFILAGLVIPPLAVLRFFILTPLTWLSPSLRRWAHQRASSLIVDPTYIRPLPTKRTLRIIRWQEVGCFLWCLGIAVVPPVFLDRWPIPFLIHAYLTAVVIVTLNGLRTLGAHRWTNEGGQMNFIEQLLDTANYPHRAPISELWGPVGTRYHALHHLFPSLPYHALGAAHRRLMAELPADSPYRRTEESSLTAALLDLWRRAQGATRATRQDAGRPVVINEPLTAASPSGRGERWRLRS